MEEHRAAEHCAYPPELDEIDLIAAADEEAMPPVLAHLATCSYCTARAQEIADLQGRLRERLYRLFCPTSDDLANFSGGTMIPEERERVIHHLAECSRCRAELALLEEITAISPARPPGRPLRRVVANPLRSDRSWPPSLFTEEVVYHAGMLRIALCVERQRGAVFPRLRGSMRGGRQHALTASLLSHGQVITSAPLDAQGVFILDDLAPGDFSLSLRLPDYEVIVEALHIP